MKNIIKNIMKNDIFKRKLKFPGRTVLRIESYKKKFFCFILDDFLKIYCNIFEVITENSNNNIHKTIAIIIALKYEYHRNIHKIIVSINIEIHNIFLSFLDKLLKKLSWRPTFGRALNNLIIGSENENKNNKIHKIAHLIILIDWNVKSLEISIVCTKLNVIIFHNIAIM